MRNSHAKHAADLRITLVGFIILAIVVAELFSSCSTQRGCPSHRNMSGYSILKWHTDKRGLISVVWRDNSTGKEWGLDYATKEELREQGLIK